MNYRLAVSMLLLMMISCPGWATVYTLSTSDDIQTCINSASDGDEIVLLAGTYYQNISFNHKNITIRSSAPADPGVTATTTLARATPGPTVTFSGLETNAKLLGLTVTHYSGNLGSGILIMDQAAVTIERCVIKLNTLSGGNGGGVAWLGGSGTMAHNTITQNSGGAGGGIYVSSSANPNLLQNAINTNIATSAGGGIYWDGSPGTIEANAVSNNRAPFGAGLRLEGGAATVTSNTFSANVNATGPGGGVLAVNWTGDLTNNTFENNSASSGAGLYLDSPHCSITSNTFKSNVATNSGGGAGLCGTNLVFDGNVLQSNQAGEDGGGIALMAPYSHVRNNTFTDNQAVGNGGAMQLRSDATVRNNTLLRNKAANGGGMDVQNATNMFDLSFNTVKANVASNAGGALNVMSCSAGAQINDNVIEANTAQTGSGGGMRLDSVDAGIARNRVRMNTAGMSGGGIFAVSGDYVIDGNTVVQNRAELAGGIILMGFGAPRIEACLISQNYASRFGGGLLVDIDGLNIINTSICGNTADDYAGGVWSERTPTLINCTIAANTAPRAGGYWSDTGTVNLNGCIIAGNTGGGIWSDPSSLPGSPRSIARPTNSRAGLGGAAFVLRYCNVYGNTVADYYGVDPQTGSDGNLSVEPLLADPSRGDAHLRSTGGRYLPDLKTWVIDSVTSPCIDAGDPGAACANEPAPNGGRRNMGAFGGTAEASKSPNQAPPAPTAVVIKPAAPITTQDLQVTISHDPDPDGDTVQVEVQWALWDSGLGTWEWSQPGLTVPASQTMKGQQWLAKARTYDGRLRSAWVSSAEVVIDDTRPTPPNVVYVRPSKPRTAEVIQAFATGASDTDGEVITYTYRWYYSNDGGTNWFEDKSITTDTVPVEKTALGQQWRPLARSLAGGSYSSWVQGDVAEVINTAPSVPKQLAVSPVAPGQSVDLTAVADGSTDPDTAQVVQYDYAWRLRTSPNSAWSAWRNLGSVLPASSTLPGQEWQVRARAHDGVQGGAWLQAAPVAIVNNAPTVPDEVALSPANPGDEDRVRATAEGIEDPDGDPLTLQYQWRKSNDGGKTWLAWIPGGRFLEGTETTIGMYVQARARAYDGNKYSLWRNSASLRIVSMFATSIPANNQTDVSRLTQVTIVFRWPMNEASVESHFQAGSTRSRGLKLVTNPGTFKWLTPGRKLCYTYAKPLAAATDAYITITAGAMRGSGVAMNWSEKLHFVTGSEPVVTSYSPQGVNIPALAPLAVQFDQSMNRASVMDNLTTLPAIPGKFEWAGQLNQIVRFRPAAPLEPNTTFQVILSKYAKATTGTRLRSDLRWEFSTGAAIDPAMVATASKTGGGGTVINLQLNTAAVVRVSICNLAGRVVAVLPERTMPAGANALLWYGRSSTGTTVPAGRYLATVTAVAARGRVQCLTPLQR